MAETKYTQAQIDDLIAADASLGRTEVVSGLVLSDIAYSEIQGKKKVARLTHASYDQAAKKADRMIEENNREYVATYREAAFYYG